MNKNLTIVLTAAASALFLTGQAHALTLTNRDAAEQRLQIVDIDEMPVTQDVVINANQTLDALCEEGCTIALENGEQGTFDGDEVVYIEDGRFVIAE